MDELIDTGLKLVAWWCVAMLAGTMLIVTKLMFVAVVGLFR